MNKTFGAMPILALVLALPMAARADGIPWSTDFNAAKADARQSGKLIMLDVYTDWCGWCKKLDTDVYPKDSVIQAAGQFIPLKLNAEKGGEDVARQYKVHSYPMILFIEGDGTLVGKIIGYKPEERFVASMQQVVKNNQDFPDLEKRVNDNPDDVSAANLLISQYLERNRTDDAAALALKIIDKLGDQAGSTSNMVAGAYADDDQTDKAITWYKWTIDNSKAVDSVVQAHIGLYSIYQAKKDKDQMRVELQALIDLPGADQGIKDRAKEILAKL